MGTRRSFGDRDDDRFAGPRLVFTQRHAAHLQINGQFSRVARIFNTYGPGMSVYGSGEQTRSFCYVDDLVEGLARLMETSDEVTGPVNLGNPVEFTIKQLAEAVIALTGSSSKIVYHPLPQDDPKQRQPDISLARGVLQWAPRVQLEEGFKKTIEYFEQLLSSNHSAAARG